MIISRLDLKAYGRFTDVSLDLSAGPHQFHLIYGPNESGKSTSLRAITSWLYGIPHSTADNFVHQNPKLRVGGVLTKGSHELECVRRKGNRNTLRDADDDQSIDEQQLQEFLSGVSEDDFRSRFGISHQEVLRGGSLILDGEGDLGQILFSAGAGIGKLREIEGRLEEDERKLFKPKGKTASINVLLSKLKEQQQKLDLLQVRPATYQELCNHQQELTAEVQKLDAQVRECSEKLSLRNAYLKAIPLVPELRLKRRSLKSLADVPMLDEGFTDRRRSAELQYRSAQDQIEERQSHVDQLRRDLQKIADDSQVSIYEAQIESVFQQIAAKKQSDQLLAKQQREKNDCLNRIEQRLEQLSVELERDEQNQLSTASLDHAIGGLKVSDADCRKIRELANNHQKFVTRRDDAEQALTATRRKLKQAEQRLNEIDLPADPASLTSVLDSVGPPASLRDNLAQQQTKYEAAEAECGELLRGLEGFDGNLQQAIQLRLPTAPQRKELAEAIEQADRKAEQHDREHQKLAAEKEKLKKQLQQQQHERSLPTLDELEMARRSRDTTISQLLDQVDHEPASIRGLKHDIHDLQSQVQQADRLADQIREHYTQIHSRDQLVRQIETLQRDLETATTKLDQHRQLQSEVRQRWKAVWQQSGIVAGDPESMQNWMQQHEKLLVAAKRMTEEERQRDQIRDQVNVAVRRLRSALRGAGVESEALDDDSAAPLFMESPEDRLPELHDLATSQRNEIVQRKQLLDVLNRDHKELSNQLAEDEARLETAERQLDQWQKQWKETTESFVRHHHTDTSEVQQMLEHISEIHRLKQRLDELEASLDQLQIQKGDFESAVTELANSLDEPNDQQADCTELASRLYKRLQQERKSAENREMLSRTLANAEKQLAKTKQSERESRIQLQQLCEEAGREQAIELPDVERQARERSRLSREVEELETRLEIICSGEPLNEFISAAQEQRQPLLENEIAVLQSELESLQQQQREIQQQIGANRHRIDEINGSADAAELSQTIQIAAGQIGREAEHFAQLRVARLLLKRAIETYRKTHQNPMLRIANQYFRQLTCGEYKELKPDYDEKGRHQLCGINVANDWVPASQMSDGTADALYLALRLASIEYQSERGSSLPLIIDDCLIQLDDQRATAALQAFSSLSEHNQIIFFTHHWHVVELAKQHLARDGFHLHRLDQAAGSEADESSKVQPVS